MIAPSVSFDSRMLAKTPWCRSNQLSQIVTRATRPIRKRTHEAQNGLQDFQSILALERFTTSAHFAESLRITSANSSGVPPAGSSPISPNLVLNMGETIALLTEEFSLSTKIGRAHV